MRFIDTSGIWAIEPAAARHYLRVYEGILLRRIEGEGVPVEVEAAVPSRGDVGQVRRFAVEQGVATINVRGPIVPHADLVSQLSNIASVEGIKSQLSQAISSEDVNAVIMAFDSPGGAINGISDLAHFIRAASEQKPIVAFVEGACASAANWLAAGATQRVISKTGIMGSIGTKTGWTDDRKLKANIGLEDIEFISSDAPLKSPDAMTDAGKAQIQRMVNDAGAVFTADMADLYGVPVATVKEDFGKGDVLIGKRAVKAGLADRVGSYEQVFAELARGKMPKRASQKIAATAAQGANMNALERIRAILNNDDSGEESTPETQATATVPVATLPPTPVMVAGMTEPEILAMKAQLDAQQAQAAAVAEQMKRDEAIRAEEAATSFANQFASAFLENGSEATGEESDRTKLTKALTDLHLAAQQTGTVEQLTALCAHIPAVSATVGGAVLGAEALANAKPVENNGNGEKVGVKAAATVKDKYKGVDPTAPYTES